MLIPSNVMKSEEQISSICSAAEAVQAVSEMRRSFAIKIDESLEASVALYGSRGVVPWIPPPRPLHLMSGHRQPEPVVVPSGTAWQPRWPGDVGDPFEPCMQLLQQFLHGAMNYHTRCLEQLTAAYGAVRLAAKTARDVSYIRSQAGNAGISVKEYQRLLEMFTKIDLTNTGNVSKAELMAAMKRDKDIAAFMQLSRARTKDGRRESFDSVFNRIDNTGQGAITWHQFLLFFSTGRSLLDHVPSTRGPSPRGTRAPSPRGTVRC